MSDGPPPDFDLLEQTLGYFYSAALRAAARLGIADQLVDCARTPEELAEKVGADGSSIHRLLRLLATRDVFCEDETGRFHLTASAELLRADVSGSMRPDEVLREAGLSLTRVVPTSTPLSIVEAVAA